MGLKKSFYLFNSSIFDVRMPDGTLEPKNRSMRRDERLQSKAKWTRSIIIDDNVVF